MKEKFTAYAHMPTDSWGLPFIASADVSGTQCFEHYVAFGPFEVELDIPEINLRQAQIDAIERQVQQERADSQVRVNILLDRISKLKAIAHEVEE